MSKIEQANFTYPSVRKSFWNQVKTIEDQGKQALALQSLKPKQQLKSVEDLFPKNLFNIQAKGEIAKIKTIEQ